MLKRWKSSWECSSHYNIILIISHPTYHYSSPISMPYHDITTVYYKTFLRIELWKYLYGWRDVFFNQHTLSLSVSILYSSLVPRPILSLSPNIENLEWAWDKHTATQIIIHHTTSILRGKSDNHRKRGNTFTFLIFVHFCPTSPSPVVLRAPQCLHLVAALPVCKEYSPMTRVMLIELSVHPLQHQMASVRAEVDKN